VFGSVLFKEKERKKQSRPVTLKKKKEVPVS
jgi:hypothetical protein